MSTWDLRDEHRLLAVLTLLDRLYQAQQGPTRTAEVSDQVRDGDRPSGRPPAGGVCPDTTCARTRHPSVIRELAQLLCQQSKQPTGSRARRIAELWEVLDETSQAYSWWQTAADLGDVDAQDYLEVLHDEVEDSPRPSWQCSAGQSLHTQPASELLALLQEAQGMRPLRSVLVNPAELAALLQEASPSRESQVELMMREIEEYLEHPEHVMNQGRPQ
ncbi:hypothetical protein ABZ622_38735 [Streptomyces sp. NPDC007164]|uniref:hypothetical protein n=1 Tax=Streptomyces sp. NPDC007164 TaxID=3156918 RepID=UPI0033E91D65